MRPTRRLVAIAAGLAILAGGLSLIPATFAAFSARTETAGNNVTAATDFRPPQVTAVAVGKTSGGATGFLKQGGGYFVYANVAADTGNPASGIATVTANVSSVTAGSTAIPLTAGSFSAGGISYGYRSASLLADGALTEGAKSFSVSATDNALNASSANGTVTIDNTPPSAADVQTTNAGTNGLAEQNDTLVLTFSEPIEPESILAGWSGAATNVVVRIADNGILGLPLGNDTVQVFNASNTTALPLGTVDLGRNDYVSGLLGGSIRFGATGTASTMTMSGNTVTIVLGTYNATPIVDPTRTTAAAAGAAAWTPVATPYDRATNTMSTTAANESGGPDRDF